tara:strand:- start:543 stop:1106 length:564 start_codon:yes stop_codon:yes gene_type:complete
MTALTLDRLTHIVVDELEQDGDDYKVFVESGTYLGETIIQLQPYFETLYTIELSEEYYDKFTRIKEDYEIDNIANRKGDTTEILPDILRLLDDKDQCIFWLDGHWSSGNTAKGDKDCPLIEECESINNLYPSKKVVILIDDYRLFGTNINEDWSDITIDKVKGCFTSFNIVNEIIHDDVLAFYMEKK